GCQALGRAAMAGGRGVASRTIWARVKEERLVAAPDPIRSALDGVGIRVDISYLTDWPAFSRMRPEGKMPMFLYAWFGDAPDADNFLTMLFHSRSSRNFTGYGNPGVDALLEQARRPGDPLHRADLYRRAAKLVVDDA